MNTKRGNLILFISLLTAFLLRFIFAFYMSATHNLPHGDEVDYDTLAWNIVQHHEYAFELGKPTIRRSPSYPFFLAGVYALCGHSYLAVRIAQAIVGTLTCFVIFLVAHKLFNEGIALIASGIVTIYPFFIYYTAYLIIETLFIFLIALLVYQLIRTQSNPSAKNFIISGIIMGVAALCKSVVYPFIPFIALAYLFLFGFKNIKTYRNVILFILFSFLTIFPWGMRNYIVLGKFCIIQSHIGPGLYESITSYREFSPSEIESLEEDILTDYKNSGNQKPSALEMDALFLKRGIRSFLQNPLPLLTNIAAKCFKFFRPYPLLKRIDPNQAVQNYFVIVVGFIIFDIMIVFSFYGIWLTRRNWGKLLFLYIPIISFILVHSFLWITPRLRRPVIPLFIIFSAVAIEHLSKKIMRKYKKHRIPFRV